MDKKTRYFLLFFGFIIFLILAPALIMYISGRKFDLNSGQYEHTGILEVVSNPNNAKVYLDDKLIGNTPLTSRFINQGQYHLKVEKDNYYSWEKTIFIEQGKVTYAHSDDQAITLWPNNIPLDVNKEPVVSYQLINNQIALQYKNNSIHFVNAQSLTETNIINIKDKINKISKLNDNLLLIDLASNKLEVYNVEKQNIVATFNKNINFNKLIASSDNTNLIWLNNNQIMISNINNPNEGIAVKNNVLGFNIINNTMYAVEIENNNLTVKGYNVSGKSLSNMQVLLSTTWQNNKPAELYVTPAKSIYIIQDNKLYKAGNNKLEELSQQTQFTKISNNQNVLVWKTPTEILRLPDFASQPQLLTRTSQTINDIFSSSNFNYSLIATSTGLEILENYNDTAQNKYIVNNGQNTNNINVDNSLKYIFFQSGETVKRITLE